MPLPRKVGDRRAANWNLSSKNSRKIIVLIGDLALTNMGLGDKAAALALAERAMAANPDRKGRRAWSHSDRDPRPGGGANGRARPRHRRFTEITLDPVRRRDGSNVPLTPALLRLDPMFDPLRNDPRFQKLVDRAGAEIVFHCVEPGDAADATDMIKPSSTAVGRGASDFAKKCKILFDPFGCAQGRLEM